MQSKERVFLAKKKIEPVKIQFHTWLSFKEIEIKRIS